MKISKLARREGRELFKSCLVEGRLDDQRVRTTVQLLLEKKPRQYLAVLQHFSRLVKLEVQRRTARIETVIPLTDALRADVEASLTVRYGAGLTFEYAQTPALLGGMRVQVGSDVFDGSVRNRLAELEEHF